MRYLQRIIDQVRRQTENEDVNSFVGIQNSEFIQYLNDAQYHLQAAIVHQHPRVFIKEAILDAVVDQEKYDLPSDCFLKNKVHNVEYSSTGDEVDYYVLREDTIKMRTSGTTGSPVKYIRLAGQILLSPEPSNTGKIRLNYVQRTRELDLRIADITAVTTVDPGDTWTIVVEESTTDITSLGEHDYICIVDKEGVSVIKNIPLNSATTTLLTCGAHTIDSVEGETTTDITADHYVVGGKDTTTHCDLPRSVERFLISYCAWKILKRDSSVDSTEALQELTNMQAEIVSSYAMISDDIQFIPQLVSWDDWSE